MGRVPNWNNSSPDSVRTMIWNSTLRAGRPAGEGNSLRPADDPPGGGVSAKIRGEGTRAELNQQLARLRPHDDLELDVTGRPAGGRGVVEDEPRRVPIPNGIDRLARLALEP